MSLPPKVKVKAEQYVPQTFPSGLKNAENGYEWCGSDLMISEKLLR